MKIRINNSLFFKSIATLIIALFLINCSGKTIGANVLYNDSYPNQTSIKSLFFKHRDDLILFSEWYKGHPKVKKLRFAMIPNKVKYCAEINRFDECVEVPELEGVVVPLNFRTSNGGILFYLGIEIVDETRYDIAFVNIENSQHQYNDCQDISKYTKLGSCGIAITENWIISYEWYPHIKANLDFLKEN